MSSVVLVIGLLLICELSPRGDSRWSFCLFKAALGFDCPGCGMTRATCSILHFDFKNALTLNAAAFLFVPLAFIQISLGFYPSNLLSNVRDKLMKLLIVVLVLNYLLKFV